MTTLELEPLKSGTVTMVLAVDADEEEVKVVVADVLKTLAELTSSLLLTR
jgi:hypothetical protein